MNKLIIALLAPVFGAASASALAEELPKTRSMADICPSKISRIMVNAPTDLVLRIPEPGLRMSDEARAEAERQQLQCMEWQRKLAGVPSQTWNKMSDSGRVDAVEKAKSERLSGRPADR